jgi:hypothetical protein
MSSWHSADSFFIYKCTLHYKDNVTYSGRQRGAETGGVEGKFVIVYLMTEIVVDNVQWWMVSWLVNDEFVMWKDAVMA